MLIMKKQKGQEVLKGEQVPEVLRAFAGQVEALEAMEPAAIKAAIKAVQKETGHKGKKPIYANPCLQLTGQTHGPELPNAIALLGKEKVLNRLQKVIG